MGGFTIPLSLMDRPARQQNQQTPETISEINQVNLIAAEHSVPQHQNTHSSSVRGSFGTQVQILLH